MPPHGRRRVVPSLHTMLFLFLSLVLPLVAAVPSVVGIDLGTENIKAVLVKPGIPLDIVLAKDSKRKEPGMIAFKPGNTPLSSSKLDFPERLWGSDAAALHPRFPGDVYANLKPLLGLTAGGNPLIKAYESRYPSMQVRTSKDRNTLSIKSNEAFHNDEEAFLVEELLGMQLQNVRANAEAMAGKGTTVRDAVITIPVYFSSEEKRAIEAAAKFAGLKVLAMTTDGLAVGLNYATSRTFPVISDGAKPEYHMVFDMGAGSTTATVLRFQGRKVKDIGKFNKTIQEVQVVGAGWDKSLGGDALNSIVLDDLIQELAENKQIKALGASEQDIRKNGRTMAKLLKEVQRMRQVLSANTETQASFEGLYQGEVNFKYKITRAHFEKLAVDYEARVKNPILQALEMAKLELSDIESVILHGGAMRTPFVQKALEAAVGSADKLKTNVNSDESAAFGAAFKAAGLVPSFRVKEIRTSEAAVYPASLSYTIDGKEKHQTLFGSNSLAGKEKNVPLKFVDDFTFSFSQQVPDKTDGTRVIQISTVSTTNLTAAVKELKAKFGCEPADISTQFSIGLSPINGLPEATRGSVSCEAVVEQKKAGVMDGVKGMFGFGKKDDQQVLEEKDASSSSSGTSASASSSSADAQASDAKDETPKEPEKQIQVIYVGLKTEETGLPSISTKETQRIKDRMKAFDQSDKNRKLREEALNVLEGYTYKIRDIIEDEGFIAASTEKVRKEIEKKAAAAGEWLYGDGADAKLKDFQDRLKELKALVDPIEQRKNEAVERPAKIEHLRDTLNQTKVMLEGLVKEHAEKKAAAEAASASLSSAAASASASTPTTSVSETPSASSSVDELDALDDEASSTTEEPEAEATPEPEIEQPVFTDDDLDSYQDRYEVIQKWFDEKVAAQAKLKAVDSPAALVAEWTKKADDVQKLIVDVITKQMASYGTQGPKKGKSKAKSGKAKGKGKGKGKGKKSKNSASAESEATQESVVEEKTAKESPSVKDEL